MTYHLKYTINLSNNHFVQVRSIAESSSVRLTYIKLPHGVKTFVLSILSGRLRQVSL